MFLMREITLGFLKSPSIISEPFNPLLESISDSKPITFFYKEMEIIYTLSLKIKCQCEAP